MNLINAVRESGAKNLVFASANLGYANKEGTLNWGLAVLLKSKQIKRVITSFGA